MILYLFIFLFSVHLSFQCEHGWIQSTVDPTKCYWVDVSLKTWQYAEEYCKGATAGAHLTSITSAFETYSLQSVVSGKPGSEACHQFWIGASKDSGNFAWLDGKLFQYTDWAPGQPDANTCVSTLARTTGKWKTEACNVLNCFICSAYDGGTPPPPGMTDCYDWKHKGGATTSGIYRISPAGVNPFDVYCDMETEGGGWTVFQQRMDEKVIFYTRTWSEYKNGFDNGLTQNFWLGNDNIHVLSSKDPKVQLRIDLWGDRDPDHAQYKNSYFYAEYNNFKVDSEAMNYTLHVSPCVAGNASYPNNNMDIIWNNNRPFSTADFDHDGGDCANTNENGLQMGGWWANHLGKCGYVALNGKYVPSAHYDSYFGMTWLINTGEDHLDTRKYIQPVKSQMKMRKVP